MDAGQAWWWVGEISTKRGYIDRGKELGFYAKSPRKPSKGFKQERNLLAFNLVTVQKGYFDCWVEKGLQGPKLGRIEIRGCYKMTGGRGWCLGLG